MRNILVAMILFYTTMGFAVTANYTVSTYIFVTFKFDSAEKSIPNFENWFAQEFKNAVEKEWPQTVQDMGANEYRVSKTENSLSKIQEIVDNVNLAIKTKIYRGYASISEAKKHLYQFLLISDLQQF